MTLGPPSALKGASSPGGQEAHSPSADRAAAAHPPMAWEARRRNAVRRGGGGPGPRSLPRAASLLPAQQAVQVEPVTCLMGGVGGRLLLRRKRNPADFAHGWGTASTTQATRMANGPLTCAFRGAAPRRLRDRTFDALPGPTGRYTERKTTESTAQSYAVRFARDFHASRRFTSTMTQTVIRPATTHPGSSPVGLGQSGIRHRHV